jgi:hypothetical protein
MTASIHQTGAEDARGARTTVAATIAIVGVVTYVLVDVVLQFLPPHYSAIAQAESDLAVGPYGWIMAINFFGRGVTSAAAIVALVGTGPRGGLKTVGMSLFGVAGACSALIAFSPTDVALVGTAVAHPTVHGTIHIIGASSGFVFALAAFWLLTIWGWRVDALRTSRVPLAVFLAAASAGLVFLGITIAAAPRVFGLAERICLAGILGWVFVIAFAIRRGSK